MKEENTHREKSKRKVTIKKLYFFVGIIILIWITSWVGVNCLYSSTDERGTFGDQFGAVNALFSGLAFAGLIYTILLQHEELSLQRQELEDTRKELEGQRLEAEMQNKIMLKQQFENTFFQLLRMHHGIVDKMSLVDTSSGKVYDFQVFFNFYMRFSNDFNSMCNGTAYLNYGNRLEKRKNLRFVEFVFLQTYKVMISDFGSYSRNLYRIIKFVDTHTLLSPDEKYEYVALVRAQLSDFEMIWLFYNCLTENGKQKFKPLIEKYAFFNNLRKQILVDEAHRVFYEDGAFERMTV